MGCGGEGSHTTRGTEHQWSKGAVFYLSDSVFIAPLFLLLMSTVDRAKLKVPVGRCVGVEYPDIEKCTSVPVTPEALCPNVQTGTIISIGGGVEKELCGQSLEWWLYANIMACIRHDIGSEVPDLIVSDGGEATHAEAECVLHREGSTTGTLAGDIRRLPAISEAQGITEITLVKDEPKFFYW